MWIIETPVKSQNDKIFGKNRGARFAYADYRNRVARRIFYSIGKKECLDYSVWCITRFYGKGKRKFDSANMTGGCKPIVDSLVLNGYIKDDSMKHFFCFYRQESAEIDAVGLEILGTHKIDIDYLIECYKNSARG